MKLNFGPRGVLQIDDARIIFRNFSGRGDKFNREGDRNFAVVIEDEAIANDLIADGWNVKINTARDEGDIPFMYLPVKIKFNDRGPSVHIQSGRARTKLSEETVSMLDNIDILGVDLDVRPYDWDVNGKTGRTAYLQSMEVIQRVDRFTEKYNQQQIEDDLPFC